MVVKNMSKSGFLDWLRGKCSISDPSSAMIFEDIIKRVEDGEFDNTKDSKMKLRVDCEFLKRVISHVPYEEGGEEESGEYIIFHNCLLCDKDIPCIYPSRFCRYKTEFDEFAEYIFEIEKKCGEIDSDE